jgi:hypothetical protein
MSRSCELYIHVGTVIINEWQSRELGILHSAEAANMKTEVISVMFVCFLVSLVTFSSAWLYNV